MVGGVEAVVVHLHTLWYHPLQLVMVPLVQILYLDPDNLHCVVVVSGGGT